MIKTGKMFGAFVVAMAMALTSCGKGKTKTVYVNNPETPQQTNPSAMPFPSDSARQMDLLAVEITNFASVNGQAMRDGSQIDFRLRNSQAQIYGVQYKCVIEQAGRAGTVQPRDCSSPYRVDISKPGQYRFTVFAVHPQSSVSGHPAQVTYAVGQSSGGGLGPSGVSGQGSEVQVGDLFLVGIPQGMHVVYRTSTFDQPGAIRRRMIDASMGDTAAPYPLNCGQTGNPADFQQLVPDVTPMGQQLQYCETSLPLNYNVPSDFTMSYNSLGLSSDASLSSQPMVDVFGDVPSRLYINVFTQIPGVRPTNQFNSMFTNEFSATASRMQLSCGMNPPEYLGTAQIFQGYYAGQMGASHLYGCPSKRNGKTYVNVAAFVVDQVSPLNQMPNCDWRCLREQNMANQRAAEIVVEFGPFDQEVTSRGQVRRAQEIMMNHIRKLTP
jgi:hypothetical protein